MKDRKYCVVLQGDIGDRWGGLESLFTQKELEEKIYCVSIFVANEYYELVTDQDCKDLFNFDIASFQSALGFKYDESEDSWWTLDKEKAYLLFALVQNAVILSGKAVSNEYPITA